MSIGELRAALLEDYPDITISKIRYLEEEGLIQPARTASSYRKFSFDDLNRLRYVLTQQRDHYLPLKVIKENLDALDRGLTADASGTPRVPSVALTRGADGLPSADDFVASTTGLRLSRTELLAESGLTEDDLVALEQYGVLTAERGGYFDSDALVIAATVAQMRQYGIEARHLRPFRTQADREIGLLEQVITPMMRQRTPEARGRAEETMRELSALSVRLHAALVRTGLRRELRN